MRVRLDLNNAEFQKDLFSLEKKDFFAAGKTTKKLVNMNWEQVCRDKGLLWEKIYSVKTPKGRHLYSIRLGKKHRAVVFRKDEFMIFVSLHPDHDSAYG
ncbi:MAG: hypothetical protein ACLFRG_22775 [Desulfococcaceae bacterium]